MANKKASLENGNAVMVNSEYDLSHPYTTNVLVSQDVNEIYDFLRMNMTTAGFTVQYGINHKNNFVGEFFRKGKMGKRDIKMLIDKYGIGEWHYSLCWAAKYWVLADGEQKTAVHIDLSPVETTKTAYQYRNVLVSSR